jgi:predicted site-specific integrase-resolvase
MTEARCALYARVSSEAQARDNTIASQVIEITSSRTHDIAADEQRSTAILRALGFKGIKGRIRVFYVSDEEPGQ